MILFAILLAAAIDTVAVDSLEVVVDHGILHAPEDIAWSPRGGFWVADQGPARLHFFTTGGWRVDSFGNSGQGGIEFTDRIAVTDPGGQYIYVADTDASRLLKVTRSGVPVSELTLPEGLQAWSWKPRALASLPDGRVFIADEGSGGITVTDPFDGLRRLSGPGNEAAGALLASGLACDGSTLALGDEVGGEIRLLDLHGNELARVSVGGTPGSLTLRADGLGAVVDEEGHVVRLFQGTAWSGVVHPGSCPETFEPSAVCFAGDGSLLVADRAGHRILRLALPEVP